MAKKESLVPVVAAAAAAAGPVKATSIRMELLTPSTDDV